MACRVTAKAIVIRGISMKSDETKVLEEALSHIVGNTCRLSRTSACYGWNVVGPGARALASCLDRQSAELHNALNPLARHIRGMGMPVILDYSDVSMSVDPPRDYQMPITDDMIGSLVRGHEEACMSLRAAMDLSAEIEEHATTTLLANRMAAHRDHICELSIEQAPER